MHKRPWSLACLPVSLVLAVLLSCNHAFAHDGSDDDDSSFTLALDLQYASAISNDIIEEGGGAALRIGTEHDLLLVTMIPEVLLDSHSFGADRDDDASVVTAKVGGRIRFLKIVEPGIFAHLGVGHIGGDDRYSHTGVAFDAGVTLDLTLLPLIDLGLHAGWNRVFGGHDKGLSYGTAGIHAALVL